MVINSWMNIINSSIIIPLAIGFEKTYCILLSFLYIPMNRGINVKRKKIYCELVGPKEYKGRVADEKQIKMNIIKKKKEEKEVIYDTFTIKAR